MLSHSLKTQGFRFSFTPLPGSFSPFPHGTILYRSLTVFSLGGWSPLLPTGFPVSRGTLVQPGPLRDFAYASFTLSGWLSQNHSAIVRGAVRLSATPECMHSGLGSLPFARRYLGDRGFFLFLRLLRCFSSPAYLPYAMDSRMDAWSLSMRVAPFGYLRIKRIFAPPRSFSQLITSFIGCQCQGIRPAPFLLDLAVKPSAESLLPSGLTSASRSR
jgi:hypothetical protein